MQSNSPHFSVETLGEGGIHSHQVHDPYSKVSTMVTIAELPLPPTTATISIPLPFPARARALQSQMLGASLGRYSRTSNSCLTTARDVLREGGADIPSSNVLLKQWVETKLKNLGE